MSITGRSNTNVVRGCCPAFALCSLENRVLFLRLMTTGGEISTYAKAAASDDLGGEGTDGWATIAWLSGWALLNPKQGVILRNPVIFTFPFNRHPSTLGISRKAMLLRSLSVFPFSAVHFSDLKEAAIF